MPVIEIEDLTVHYGRGRKRAAAVKGISFQVNPGECVGFIGANGAGKSTTIKTMLGFVFPSSGSARLFGDPAGSVRSRRRIGYLPEVALYYPFMKARELLELYGGLHGLGRAALKRKIPEMLEKVGLGDKGESLLRTFSKGMQQRLGIAQAIIADPEALIFDELNSGLDPVGRHDLREVLLDLKKKGRTIFFSSHELTEVEALCDRVIVIHEGRIVTQSPVEELMGPLNLFEITFRLVDEAAMPETVRKFDPAREGELMRVTIPDAAGYTRAVADLAASGSTIMASESRTRSLEEYFIELVRGREGAAAP